MAISANFTSNPTVAQIIKNGFQVAGLLRLGATPRSDQMADARELLENRLKELQAKGVILATEEQTTLTTVSGTASYILAADTVDIDGDGMILQSGDTNRTVVLQVSYDDYHHLSDLTMTGVPTQMYIEKQAATTVFLWPVPDATMTMDYRRIRLLRDIDSDGVNVDIWRRGVRLMTAYCAYDFACNGNVPLNKIELLRRDMVDAEKTFLGDTHEKGDLNFHF